MPEPVPEMVEKVARAMHARFAAEVAQSLKLRIPPETWEEAGECVQRFYLASAREGIEILREPTDDMLMAGLIPTRDDRASLRDGEADRVWLRMIDAALGTHGKGEGR